MDVRHGLIAELATEQHGAVSLSQLAGAGISSSLRSRWVARGLITNVGPKSFALAGSAPTWKRAAWAAAADIEGVGYVGGRTAARLQLLDGFETEDIEVLVSRARRGVRSAHRVCSTSSPLSIADTIVVDGIRCLTVERLILDAPLFDFTKKEIENAIDSGIRKRLVSEQRLRTKVIARHSKGINGGRLLLDALVDTGGESRLERWFLALVRRAGLPRPELQRTWRDGQRTIARVDAFFAHGLVVELAGHGTHSSRSQVQNDEQRRTELVLRGLRVITFTYDDVRSRPDWVIARLQQALALAA